MNERLYNVVDGENAVYVSEIGEISNVLAKIMINPDSHHLNGQWNGTHQADLEGYVAVKEDDQVLLYKIVGFADDSKALLDSAVNFKDDAIFKTALKKYCSAYDPHTNEKINLSEIEQILQ